MVPSRWFASLTAAKTEPLGIAFVRLMDRALVLAAALPAKAAPMLSVTAAVNPHHEHGFGEDLGAAV